MEEGRGSPPASVPMSVVVPPTSITTPSFTPAKKAAPRREFTGPLWKVAIGTYAGEDSKTGKYRDASILVRERGREGLGREDKLQ